VAVAVVVATQDLAIGLVLVVLAVRVQYMAVLDNLEALLMNRTTAQAVAVRVVESEPQVLATMVSMVVEEVEPRKEPQAVTAVTGLYGLNISLQLDKGE
jgi:hypothetical protein